MTDTDQASGPTFHCNVEIEKNLCVLGLAFSVGDVTSGGVFAFFWPTLPGPGRQSNEPIFWRKVLLNTRLSSESLEPF